MSNIASKGIKHSSIVLFITLLIPATLLLAILIKIAYAWTNPTQAPPGGSGAITVSGSNVGIGTTSPADKLEVASGTIRAASGLSYGISIGPPGGTYGNKIVTNGNDLFLGINPAKSFFILDRTGTGIITFRESSGNVGIATNNPPADYRLYVNGDMFVNGTISQPSDSRLKTNIVPLTGALDRLVNLQGVYFDWVEPKGKMRGGLEGRQVGLIAQEVQKVFPEVVSEDSENHYLGVDYVKLVPILLEGIKELDAKNKDLEMRVKRLEKKLE